MATKFQCGVETLRDGGACRRPVRIDGEMCEQHKGIYKRDVRVCPRCRGLKQMAPLSFKCGLMGDNAITGCDRCGGTGEVF